MTIEDLWNNLKPLVDNLKEKVDNLEGRFDNMENKFDNLSLDVKEIKNEVKEINSEVHKNNVNITALLTGQENIRQELSRKAQENIVEHKKFEYQIANLEWKAKLAN